MEENKPDHLKAVPLSLNAAMRRARLESAEQYEAVAELRQAEIARLELLQEAVQPVIDHAPEGIDSFDVGIAHGERPRLFIDMIGFVEMAHDRRTYRFLQDTRHGRVLIAESDRIDRLAEAITNYVARRIVERERALASDWRSNADAGVDATRSGRSASAPDAELADRTKLSRRRRSLGRPGDALNFLLLMLGSLTFAVLLGLGAYALWLGWGRALWTGWFGEAPH
jgi:hypothetical protein